MIFGAWYYFHVAFFVINIIEVPNNSFHFFNIYKTYVSWYPSIVKSPVCDYEKSMNPLLRQIFQVLDIRRKF